MTEKKKKISKLQLTAIIAGTMLFLGFLTQVSDWYIAISAKWSQHAQERELAEINRNAKIISDSTIAKITREISPLSTAQFAAYRDSVNAQIQNGKRIAFSYMNAIDSLCFVISEKERTEKQLNARIESLEVKLKVANAQNRDEALNTVMATLEKLLHNKEENQKLDSIMVLIRDSNREKINNVKSGDRAQ